MDSQEYVDLEFNLNDEYVQELVKKSNKGNPIAHVELLGETIIRFSDKINQADVSSFVKQEIILMYVERLLDFKQEVWW